MGAGEGRNANAQTYKRINAKTPHVKQREENRSLEIEKIRNAAESKACKVSVELHSEDPGTKIRNSDG